MDAFVLGAVPPYSFLLSGKLVAMLCLSSEVREVFASKYGGGRSLISGTNHTSSLCLLTTTSALGRSSVYNRLRAFGHVFWEPLGFTKGSGEFHFANGVYSGIQDYVTKHCVPSAKHPKWGTGWRNRREVIKKCLQDIGLPTSLMYHGVNREVFAAKLAINSHDFLCGEDTTLDYNEWSVGDLSEMFKDRWLLPRASRDSSYRTFTRDSYRLWG